MSAGKLSKEARVTIFAGAAACGKSTIIQALTKEYRDSGKQVLILNDFDPLFKLVQQDISFQHHKITGPDTFEVIDSVLYDEAIISLCTAADEGKEQFDEILIEIAVGHDVQGKVDISLAHRLRLIPQKLRERATIFIVNASLETRAQRNRNREGLLKTPETVFTRFYEKVDLGVDHLRESGYHFTVLENEVPSSALEQCISLLQENDRHSTRER